MNRETKFRNAVTLALVSHVGITAKTVKFLHRISLGESVDRAGWEDLAGGLDELLDLSNRILVLLEELDDGD